AVADSRPTRGAIRQSRQRIRQSNGRPRRFPVGPDKQCSARRIESFAASYFHRARHSSSKRNSARATRKTTRERAGEFLFECESQPFWNFELRISNCESAIVQGLISQSEFRNSQCFSGSTGQTIVPFYALQEVEI